MQATSGTSLTSQAAATPARPRRLFLWSSAALATYALDQATKAWAERSLTPGVARPLIGDVLQLRLTRNPGAAFSLGTGYTIVLTVIALVVVAVCLSMAARLRSRGWAVALGLLLGGALGNVTDRLLRDPAPLRGHVVDFLEIPNWPVFNVADSAICCAAALFVVLSVRGVRLDGTLDSGDHRSPPDEESSREPSARESAGP